MNTLLMIQTIGTLAMGSMLAGQAGNESKGQLTAYTESLPKSVAKIKMVPIPGGKIKIGTQDVEVKPFFIASTETTWEAFDAFLASGPPSQPYDTTEFAPDAIARPSKGYILPDLGWGHNGYPAINLNVDSVDMFCKWLSSVTKKKYRVPTEAEWELAARGGDPAWKLDKAQMEKSAWHAGNSDEETHPVGKKAPNKFGLYDIFGNVGEWATDLEGKPVLCGNTFEDKLDKFSPTTRRRWEAKWQQSDPQLPKSRWWLSDGPFAGFRIVCEP